METPCTWRFERSLTSARRRLAKSDEVSGADHTESGLHSRRLRLRLPGPVSVEADGVRSRSASSRIALLASGRVDGPHVGPVDRRALARQAACTGDAVVHPRRAISPGRQAQLVT